jgi:AcrR family transcriptional regulator
VGATSTVTPKRASAEPDRGSPGPASSKSEQTSQLIVDTALRLFRERGYDGTTMRLIASEAGVSLGNAYYYFASKEHLVQAFYDRTQAEHRAAAAKALKKTDLADRLSGVLLAWVEQMSPYHEFAGKFFKSAAEPSSALSPFSDESRPAREASVALYRDVLAGSEQFSKVPKDLAEQLPDLLWLYQMGIVLYWVHDTSRAARNTKLLIERTVPLVVRMIALSRLRPLRPMVRELTELVETLTQK